MPIVVFNNGGCSISRQRQDGRYGRNIGTVLSNPDYAKLAEAFGFYGKRMPAIEGLAPAIEAALNADKTTIIAVPLEFDGYRTPAESQLRMTGSAATDEWKKT